jgi:hypothetical protein
MPLPVLAFPLQPITVPRTLTIGVDSRDLSQLPPK